MAMVQTDRIARPGLISVRKGNRRAATAYMVQKGRFVLAFAAAFVFVTFALGFVWINHQIVQVGYDVAALHKEQTKLNDFNRELRLELANLTSLPKLEQLAVTELGLTAPSPEQVQVIE